MAWLGDGGSGKVQLVKEIPGHQPGGLEKESGKRRKQEERGSGEENKTKKERKEETEGKKKGYVKENRRGWTVPGVDHRPSQSKQSPQLRTSVFWMSFFSVNAKQLSRLRGSCKPPDKGTLCVCLHLPFS